MDEKMEHRNPEAASELENMATSNLDWLRKKIELFVGKIDNHELSEDSLRGVIGSVGAFREGLEMSDLLDKDELPSNFRE